MKAKEYLDTIKTLEEDIKRKLDLSRYYRNLAEGVKSSIITDMPKQSHIKSTSIMEEAITKAVDLETEASELNLKLNELQIKLLDFISQLDEGRYQKVLVLRYIEHRIWSDIADEMHYSKTGVMKVNKEALEKLNVIILEKS